ncbi:hypothetical protein AB0I68_31225 [Streptomyces sp. NPDC050448]|uniref:hypothetical protein n=1 Tax=Streptomyces sp. NPDC050448 TaxID=3155404 RepID=UPI00344A00CD
MPPNGSRGIHPHDLARSVLDTELGWRHPARRAELRRRASTYYQQLFADGDRARQRAVLADFAYLHRDSPLVGPLLAPVTTAAAAGSTHLDALSITATEETELPALLAMARRYEGPESARLLRGWWAHPAATWATVRAEEPPPSPAGFYLLLALGAEDLDDPAVTADPATAAAAGWLARHGDLGAGERALLVRAWLARGTYQDVSAVQTLITLRLTHHCLTRSSGPRSPSSPSPTRSSGPTAARTRTSTACRNPTSPSAAARTERTSSTGAAHPLCLAEPALRTGIGG